ncbi:MAG: hypothetical protein Q4E91_07100 [Lachnospiraceae bacterium]|nr:hypothetical protein [Lachnospiraceae bacterium]
MQLLRDKVYLSKKYVFILPKAGEFGCMFGELVNGTATLTLAQHLFCMK